MTSATERLRAMLNERGVEWHHTSGSLGIPYTWWHSPTMGEVDATEGADGKLYMVLNLDLTPEQAIAATLGDSVATSERQGVERVYLVEVSDELIESWCPLGVYLHKESAENCAETYRREEDGVRQFARVVELKVEDT